MATRATACDVIIVGGGMVGSTLAAALRGKGLRVALIERREGGVRTSLGHDQRVSTIVAGSMAMLEGLGAWPHIVDKAGPITGMHIWDDQHLGGIRFEASEVGLPALGYVVENCVLRAALHRCLEGVDDVDIHCPAEVCHIERLSDGVRVELDNGTCLHAPLIVGADGGRSWLRRVSGIPTLGRDYRQQGIVAAVRCEHHHHQQAFQRFLPTGPLAFLPLYDGACSIVWSAEQLQAERLMAMDDTAFCERLQTAFGPVLGKIEAIGSRAAFPLVAQHAAHVVRPRLALIGDAAHVIHPLAGLGVNLGLRDAMVLAQEIVDAHRFGEDIGDMAVLGRFARARLPDNLSVLAAMESLHQLFTRQLPGLAALRNLGMIAVANSGLFKRQLMRTAMGLAIPVPKRIV